MDPESGTNLAELLVEKASLHLTPAFTQFFADRQIYKFVLQYLDGKEATPRRLGAFSHLVTFFGQNDFYLPNGIHFLLGNVSNKEYVQTYVMFGGSMMVPVYAKDKLPLLKQKIDYYPYTGGSLTKEYIYDKFEDDAPFYKFSELTGSEIDLPEYSSYHSALVSAGIGARMLPSTYDAKMTSKRLQEILTYLESLPNNIYGQIVIDLSLPLLVNISDLAEIYSIDIELLKRVAFLTEDAVLLNDLDEHGEMFRIGDYSLGVCAQLLGLPLQEPWVTDEVVDDTMDRFYDDMDDPVGRAYRINNASVHNLIERLTEIYPIESITTLLSDARVLEYSPLDIIVINEGPTVYVLSRTDIADLPYINPATGNSITHHYSHLVSQLLVIESNEQLLDPAPVSSRLGLIKPIETIFVGLNK